MDQYNNICNFNLSFSAQLVNIDEFPIKIDSICNNAAQEIDLEPSVHLDSPKESKTKHRMWTGEEDKMLLELVKKNGSKHWEQIALKLNIGRDKNQCRSRYHQYLKSTNVSEQKNKRWDCVDDSRLIELVEIYGKNWKIISEEMGNRSSIQCSNRYSYIGSSHSKSKNKRWTPEEDLELCKLVIDYGTSDWKFIASHISTNRKRVQCCNRWNGHLKKTIEENFPHSTSSLIQTTPEPISLNTNFKEETFEYIEANQTLSEYPIPQYIDPTSPSFHISNIRTTIQNQIIYYNSLYTPNIVLNEQL